MPAWQVEEHIRVREAAKTDLRNRANVYANFLSATIHGQRFRAAVFQDRLEPILDYLVNGRTNELVRPSELIAVTLLNSAGDPVVSVTLPGNPMPCRPRSPRANIGGRTQLRS